MKTIKVKWFDALIAYEEFEMKVPKDASKTTINQLVRNAVFAKAVSNYSWKDK